eukprot:1096093-Lingulodinium_polyedra.AAC.1
MRQWPDGTALGLSGRDRVQAAEPLEQQEAAGEDGRAAQPAPAGERPALQPRRGAAVGPGGAGRLEALRRR